jgi:hypothetical protein
MSDFEILFWVMQGLACLWFTYQAGRFIGRKEGFDIAIGIIDEDLRKLKKALEGKV